jgi:parvulin-like peptidyl-prolyl isomerase
MAKKRQSTGSTDQPGSGEPTRPATGVTPTSRTPRPSTSKPTTRAAEYRTRAEREAELQRLILLGTAAAAVIIVILVVIALVYEGLIRPNQAVARVGDQNISVSQFQQRVRLEHQLETIQLSNAINQYASFSGGDLNTAYGQLIQQEPYSTWNSELQIPDTLANRVLNDMVNDQLIANEAAQRGITVSDEEVQAKINDFIGYDPEQVALIGTDPTTTPTPTASQTPLVSATPSLQPTGTTAPVDAASTTEIDATAEVSSTDEISSTTSEVVATDDVAATEEIAATEAVDATSEVAVTEEAPAVPATITPVVPTSAVDVTAVPTQLTPTLSVTEVQGNFETRRTDFLNRLRSASVSDDAINAFFRSQALRDKLGESIAQEDMGDNPGTALYVDARHILVETQEQAQDVLAALNSGESFADLARAVSTDTGSGAQGGELDWSPTYQFVAEFAEAVETAPIGEIVGPVESEFGFHIIQVRARERRPVEETNLDQLYAQDAAQWIESSRETNAATFETFSTWTDNVPNLTFTYEPF